MPFWNQKICTNSGGGGTTTGGTTTIPFQGTINDSNEVFTSSEVPELICFNGLLYQQTGGSVTWSYSSGNITTSTPVGVGGSIFGVGGIPVIVIQGTINDSNESYTYPVLPIVATINGSSYLGTGGDITWIYNSGSMTLSDPVGTGGCIFGMTGVTPIIISGTVDDSNTIFSSNSEPTYLFINGSMYLQVGGNITWLYILGTIIISSPVGTGGSIFAF